MPLAIPLPFLLQTKGNALIDFEDEALVRQTGSPPQMQIHGGDEQTDRVHSPSNTLDIASKG
jgi:hypothetical protein